MSLPSYAIFYKGDEEVYREFVNIGWFYDEKLIPKLLHGITYPDDWDSVQVYHERYTRNEVLGMLGDYRETVYVRPRWYKRLWWKTLRVWRRVLRFLGFRRKSEFRYMSFPLARWVYPNLIAEDLISVQPMPKSKLYYEVGEMKGKRKIHYVPAYS